MSQVERGAPGARFQRRPIVARIREIQRDLERWANWYENEDAEEKSECCGLAAASLEEAADQLEENFSD